GAVGEWSVGLLDDVERSLLEAVAVFVDGWTIEAAAQVAGMDEDRTLELTEALARHSLIYLDVTADGPRSRMLETLRTFVAERLAARPDADAIRRRTPTTTGHSSSRPTSAYAAPATTNGWCVWRQ